jgi:integrase/recombinase XerD
VTRSLRVVEPAGDDRAAGDALLAHWGQWMRAGGAADKSIRTRIEGINALRAHSGEPDPTMFTPGQLVAWLADCRSQWTRSTYSASARRWHAWLVEQDLREDDPTAKIPKPKEPRGIPRPVSDQALRDVLAVASRRTRAFILLAAYQGLRVHEVAQVRGEDFIDGWLHVTGKGGVRAALPVHVLVDYVARGWPSEGYWFPGSEDGHVPGVYVTQRVTWAFKRAGHPEFSAHALRHWYATTLLRGGTDIRTVQELMRHASLQSTQGYTQVSSLSKLDAVRRLGGPS